MRNIDAARWPAWSILREARRTAGLTQAEVAERAGTTQAEISRYERAIVLPEIATLTRIVEACGMYLELRLSDSPPYDRTSSTAMAQSVEERLDANDSYATAIADMRASMRS